MDGSIAQSISFSGSLNTDLDIKSIKVGDYIQALNIRNIYTENGIDGSGENISSNTLIPYTLPDGTNKCIGAYEDVTNNSIIYFIYNSSNKHQILRYYSATQAIQIILDGSKTSYNAIGSSSVGAVMNFTEFGYITNINLVNSLLYWIDSTGLQRYINTDLANNYAKYAKFKICFGIPPSGYSAFYIQYHFKNLPSGNSDILESLIFPTGITTRSGMASYAYSAFSVASLITNEYKVVNYGDYLEFTEIYTEPYVMPNVYATVITGTTNSWIVAENWYQNIDTKTLDVVVQPLWLEPQTVLANDSSRTQNLLNGNAYQFAVRIYGIDGRQSVLSKSSKMTYYNLATAFNAIVDYLDYTQLPTPSNCIKVDYSDNGRLFDNLSNGTQSRGIVSSVEILVRNLNTDTYRSIAILRDFELDGTYTFYNDTFGVAITQNDQTKQYDAIPISSKCQEVVNNKLFYANNVVGYDNPVIDASVTCVNALSIPDYQWDELQVMTPKYFGKYNLGIVYFDRFGRNPFVTRTDSLVLNILNPANGTLTIDQTHPITSWSVNNIPPVWATHYSWVRTKDLVHEYYTYLLSANNSGNWSATYYDAQMNVVTWASGNVRFAVITLNSDSVYTFTQGDQLRIVRFNTTSGHPYIGNYSVPIISYDATTFALKVSYNQSTNTSLVDIYGLTINVDQMQAYSPHQQQENEIYYEFSECYEVGAYGTINAYHKGGFEGADQVVFLGVSTSPATGFFYTGWDTFHISNIGYNDGGFRSFSTETQSDNIDVTRTDTYTTTQVPNPPKENWFGIPIIDNPINKELTTLAFGGIGRSSTDSSSSVTTDTVNITKSYSRSLITGVGRPNLVVPTNKRLTVGQNIQYSNIYNIGTNYNGFGSYEPLSTSDVPYGYGEINKLINVENIMLAVCIKKTFSIYVDKGILQTNNGDVQISNSQTVLGALRYLEGSHGTINPESFGRTATLVFWWDAYIGEVVQYSSNGLDVVSKYGMKNYFIDKGRIGLQAAINGQYKVLGVVHKKFNEYIISFNTQIVNYITYPAETLGYSYLKNGWNCNYSYIPEMMVGTGTDITTFQGGSIWLHTKNTSKNNFYGFGIQGVGTVAISGTTVTGTGTTFTYTFKVGDTIKAFTTSGWEIKTVVAITSDTLMTTTAFSGTASESPYYLESYPCQITPVVNLAPSTNKTFLSLSVEGNVVPNVPNILTPPTVWNTSGQKTELLESDFEFINGSYFAPFLNNGLTPNAATYGDGLISGEPMQSQAMTLQFSKISNVLYYLKSAECYVISDQLSNG